MKVITQNCGFWHIAEAISMQLPMKDIVLLRKINQKCTMSKIYLKNRKNDGVFLPNKQMIWPIPTCRTSIADIESNMQI